MDFGQDNPENRIAGRKAIFEPVPLRGQAVQVVGPEEAHATAGFWRACRLGDIWQSRTRGGVLPGPELFNGFTIGFSLLPYVLLFDRTDAGYQRRSPANDGHGGAGSLLAGRAAWPGFQRLCSLTEERRSPIFFTMALGEVQTVPRHLDGVLLPLAANGRTVSGLCGCAAPR